MSKISAKVLEDNFNQICYDDHYDDVSTETNKKLIKYVLDNFKRLPDGRLELPLLWRPEVSHLLGKNKELATSVLKSSLKKLKNNDRILLMNDSFKSQESEGILEKVPNLDSFLAENPNHSFLPHMGVFKLQHETTKCDPGGMAFQSWDQHWRRYYTRRRRCKPYHYHSPKVLPSRVAVFSASGCLSPCVPKLLLLGGDIELNPGPPKYLCRICNSIISKR